MENPLDKILKNQQKSQDRQSTGTSELRACPACGLTMIWMGGYGGLHCDNCSPRPSGGFAANVQRDDQEPVCICGSTEWRDVLIHDGRSTRRDCAECRRFLGFPIWYGKAMKV